MQFRSQQSGHVHNLTLFFYFRFGSKTDGQNGGRSTRRKWRRLSVNSRNRSTQNLKTQRTFSTTSRRLQTTVLGRIRLRAPSDCIHDDVSTVYQCIVVCVCLRSTPLGCWWLQLLVVAARWEKISISSWIYVRVYRVYTNWVCVCECNIKFLSMPSNIYFIRKIIFKCMWYGFESCVISPQ